MIPIWRNKNYRAHRKVEGSGSIYGNHLPISKLYVEPAEILGGQSHAADDARSAHVIKGSGRHFKAAWISLERYISTIRTVIGPPIVCNSRSGRKPYFLVIANTRTLSPAGSRVRNRAKVQLPDRKSAPWDMCREVLMPATSAAATTPACHAAHQQSQARRRYLPSPGR